ncbi:MAG: MerR family transcriptional regulator, partial [Lachnospiraceae bacterium]
TEGSIEAILAGEKMEQFQKIMNHIIGCAMEENSEKLSQDVSYLVHDKLMKEMDYLMRVADEKEEERFKQLDEVIRIYQKENQGRVEAAATASRLPFFRFKKKKFGRNGNKL